MTTNTDHNFTELLHAEMPLARNNQIAGVEANPDRVVTIADWRAEYCGSGGVLHGGYLMAMADGTGATLAFINLPSGATTTTIESKTNFFRPVTEGSVTATATLLHKGRSTMVVQTDITNGAGGLVSRTLQTQAVRSPDPSSALPTDPSRTGQTKPTSTAPTTTATATATQRTTS